MSLINKKVLVTGASGFIGRHLCKALFYEGATVIGLLRALEDNKFLAKQYAVDILNKTAVSQIIHDVEPELVVHMAATKNRGVDGFAYLEGYETNLMGSFNLINACQNIPNFKRFIFLGSTDEYGQLQVPFKETDKEAPNNAYGVSKLAVTELLRTLSRSSRFPSVTLRPTIVYGPGQSDSMFLPALIRALVVGKNFDMTFGEQSRDFIYIEDLVNAIIQALINPSLSCDVINISSAIPIRINLLAKMIANMLGGESESLLKFGLMEYRKGDVMQYWATNTRAKCMLGWSPKVSLNEGLQLTIEYFRKVIVERK